MKQNIEGEELMLLSSNRNRTAVLQIANTGSLPVGSTELSCKDKIEEYVKEFYATYGQMMTELAYE